MLALERTVSDLVDLAYALTPEEIELMWTSARRKEPGGSRPTEDGIVRAFPLL
jgi:hypothetical protein